MVEHELILRRIEPGDLVAAEPCRRIAGRSEAEVILTDACGDEVSARAASHRGYPGVAADLDGIGIARADDVLDDPVTVTLLLKLYRRHVNQRGVSSAPPPEVEAARPAD